MSKPSPERILGKIVKTNAHYDYVGHIYGPGEINAPPQPNEYSLGTFVSIPVDTEQNIIGLIYDTILLNPEYGRFGPRLSPESDLAIFSPDYLQEKTTLIGILPIGLMQKVTDIQQGIPRLIAPTDAPIRPLPPQSIRQFHLPKNCFQLQYLPTLLTLNTPITLPLAQIVLTQLLTIFPEQQEKLQLLQQQLSWRSQIIPFGGNP